MVIQATHIIDGLIVADERSEQLTNLYELAEVLVGAKQPGNLQPRNSEELSPLRIPFPV